MEQLLNQGAALVHEPIMTHWGDYNVRLQDPDRIQSTLFQARDYEALWHVIRILFCSS